MSTPCARRPRRRCATDSATTPGCWPTTWIPCGRSPTRTRIDREVDGHHSYVTFVTDADVLDELAALAKDAGPHEKIKRGKGVIYWQVPNKGTLDTTIGKTMGKKRYKSSTTTRNLRTLDKVLR